MGGIDSIRDHGKNLKKQPEFTNKTNESVKTLFKDNQDGLFGAIFSSFEELGYDEAKLVYQDLEDLLDNPKCIDSDQRNAFLQKNEPLFPDLSDYLQEDQPTPSKKSVKGLLINLNNVLKDMEFDYEVYNQEEY